MIVVLYLHACFYFTMHFADFVHKCCITVVNGRLRCLGSGQHLKNRFGNGYEIDVKTKLPDLSYFEPLIRLLVNKRLISLPKSALVSDADVEEVGDVSQEVDALLQTKLMPPLHTYCMALNKPLRSQMVAPNCEGAMIYDQLQVDGFVPLKMFLEWWLAEDFAVDLQEFLTSKFVNSQLLERSTAHSFRYRVPGTETPLADIFDLFETHREQLHVKDYSVGQTTLEQIFNQFASSQDNPEVEAQQVQREALRQQTLEQAQASTNPLVVGAQVEKI